MKINDITKQQRLLVFMYELEEKNIIFGASHLRDQAIAYGIAPNKKALSSMLYNLSKDNLIYKYNDGNNGWLLSTIGWDNANYLYHQLEDWFDSETDENLSVEQPNISEDSVPVDANNTMKTAFESMAQSFNSIAQSFNSLGISFNKQNDNNVKDLLDNSYQLACNNDAYIAFIISHIDTVVNAIRNGTKSPKEIIDTLMEIYSDGINPLVKNNSDLKNMLSPE